MRRIMVLGVATGLWASGSALAQEPVSIEVFRLVAEPASASDTFFGSVSAREISSLSYGARGCVLEIAEDAKHTREVRAGQTLVQLDDQRVQLALRTAAARVSELEASVEERALAVASAQSDARRSTQDLEFVTEEFQRNSALLGRGLINETTMDAIERRFMDAEFAAERAKEAIANAEAAMRRAELALDIGKLDLESARIDLEKTLLVAPFDGNLIGFTANVGDCVQEGELAAQVYVPDQKSVDVFLQISRLTGPGADGVSVGSEVRVSRVNGEACGGTITRIDTEADLENQNVELTVDVEPSCALSLFLNESVEIMAVSASESALYQIPNSAIADGNVFMLDAGGGYVNAVTAEVVFAGQRQTTISLAGADNRSIAADSTGLSDGMAVKITDPG